MKGFLEGGVGVVVCMVFDVYILMMRRVYICDRARIADGGFIVRRYIYQDKAILTQISTSSIVHDHHRLYSAQIPPSLPQHIAPSECM